MSTRSYSFMILLLTLLAALTLVASAPVGQRDVFVPPVLYPHAGTVWQIGSTHTVKWDASRPPAQITNHKGMVVLAKGGILDLDNPLASGFDIMAGTVTVKVPKVNPGTDYAVVLFGDSGNYSPTFTIQ